MSVCHTCRGTGAVMRDGDIDACPVCARRARVEWECVTQTSDEEERIRLLWMSGLSTDRIARRVGVSRNRIIGLRHRRGWPERPHVIRERSFYQKGETGRANGPRSSTTDQESAHLHAHTVQGGTSCQQAHRLRGGTGP